MRSAMNVWSATVAAGLVCALAPAARAQERPTGTPPELVAAYEALADTILSADEAEERLVRAILAAAYGHARAELALARQALKANDAGQARAAIERLAAAVGQIGTEGDNAVAGVRKRLVEGGHHHNAAGEAQGIYDQGYVIVTKAAKQAFLEASKAIATSAPSPKADALEAAWAKVEAAWARHIAAAK